MKVVKGKNGRPRLKWTTEDTMDVIAAIVSSVIGVVLALKIAGLI